MTATPLVTALSALLLAGAVQVRPGEPGQTGVDERRTAAVTLVTGQIERFTGQVDRHCGIYLLPADSAGSQAVTRQQILTALRCMQQAKRQGRQAWAVWQVAGVDATVFTGFAATRFSDLHLFDSGTDPADVSYRPCLRPSVAKDATVTCRNRPVDADGTDKALDRLHADLVRGLGKKVAAEVERGATGTVAPASATPDEALQQRLTRLRATARDTTGADWPLCPLHRTHALDLRDQHWFCPGDAVFIAPLGRLRRLRPARPLP